MWFPKWYECFFSNKFSVQRTSKGISTTIICRFFILMLFLCSSLGRRNLAACVCVWKKRVKTPKHQKFNNKKMNGVNCASALAFSIFSVCYHITSSFTASINIQLRFFFFGVCVSTVILKIVRTLSRSSVPKKKWLAEGKVGIEHLFRDVSLLLYNKTRIGCQKHRDKWHCGNGRRR